MGDKLTQGYEKINEGKLEPDLLETTDTKPNYVRHTLACTDPCI